MVCFILTVATKHFANLLLFTKEGLKEPDPATLRMTVLISPGVVNQYPFTIQLLLAFPWVIV